MGRYDVDGRLYSSFGSFLMWSLNGSPARPIHPEVRISIETQPPPVALPTNGLEFIRDYAQRSLSSPIADEIMREAFGLMDSNPRAAVVLAVSAVEARFRSLVADLVPDAAYLVEQLQTPPLEQLLVNYLPTLPFNTDVRPGFAIPTELRKQFSKAVSLRNKLVHRGAAAPSVGQTADALESAAELVRLFDYLSGQSWAIEWVSQETRKAIVRQIDG
jgi:hypothetical protein